MSSLPNSLTVSFNILSKKESSVKSPGNKRIYKQERKYQKDTTLINTMNAHSAGCLKGYTLPSNLIKRSLFGITPNPIYRVVRYRHHVEYSRSTILLNKSCSTTTTSSVFSWRWAEYTARNVKITPGLFKANTPTKRDWHMVGTRKSN